MQILNITQLLCPFGSTLEVDVLSFNEFVAVTLNEIDLFCMPELKTLDLSFNHVIALEATNTPSRVATLIFYGMLF